MRVDEGNHPHTARRSMEHGDGGTAWDDERTKTAHGGRAARGEKGARPGRDARGKSDGGGVLDAGGGDVAVGVGRRPVEFHSGQRGPDRSGRHHAGNERHLEVPSRHSSCVEPRAHSEVEDGKESLGDGQRYPSEHQSDGWWCGSSRRQNCRRVDGGLNAQAEAGSAGEEDRRRLLDIGVWYHAPRLSQDDDGGCRHHAAEEEECNGKYGKKRHHQTRLSNIARIERNQ